MIYLLKVVIFPSFLRVYQRVMMFSISIHRQIFADLLDPLWPTMTHSCLGFWNDISAMPRRHSDFSQENGGEKPSKSYGETWFFHIFPILIMCFGWNPCLFRPNLEKYRWKDVWCHCEANHVDHLQRINWHALMIAITITVIDLPKWYPPRQSTKCTSGFIEKRFLRMFCWAGVPHLRLIPDLEILLTMSEAPATIPFWDIPNDRLWQLWIPF